MRAIGAAKDAECQRRQHQLLETRDEELAITGQQAVYEIEAGDVRRRAEEYVEAAERRGRPADAIVEHVDQDQTGEEHR